MKELLGWASWPVRFQGLIVSLESDAYLAPTALGLPWKKRDIGVERQ
jgi:hypothetical protein